MCDGEDEGVVLLVSVAVKALIVDDAECDKLALLVALPLRSSGVRLELRERVWLPVEEALVDRDTEADVVTLTEYDTDGECVAVEETDTLTLVVWLMRCERESW